MERLTKTGVYFSEGKPMPDSSLTVVNTAPTAR